MKKKLLVLVTGLLFGNIAFAQLNTGGIPLSTQLKMDNQYIPVHKYSTPDFAAAAALREQQEWKDGVSKSLLVALGAPADITFPQSGILVKTNDDKLVWRASVVVDGVKGLGFCYDAFQLPEGVKCYIGNVSGDHLLGAYTKANNQESGFFANEPVQGNMATIELDIEPGVNLDDIHLHINKATAYFRGVDYLSKYGETAAKPTIDGIDSDMVNGASVCLIDAICPLGSQYFNQKRSALSIIIPDTSSTFFGLCSANMINKVGNTAASCKRYLITGTHCDESNSTSKNRYDLVLLRYNYEESVCGSNDIPGANTIVGSYFLARAFYDTATNIIKGDFLLLQPKETIPASWNVTLAGWSRDTTLSFTETDPKKFITFFHGNGDVKKVVGSHHIGSVPFNGLSNENTHWVANYDAGFIAPGAGGAGLFNGDGYMIGSLTGSPIVLIDSCNYNRNGDTVQLGVGKSGLYSKISYNWNHNDTISRKLQPWLDPANTGVLKLDGQKASCDALDSTNTVTGIHTVSIDNDINVYPNPTANGTIHIQFNLADIANVKIDLFDFTGKWLKSYTVSKVKSGVYTMNVDGRANGMYMLHISDGTSVANKKIMLQH